MILIHLVTVERTNACRRASTPPSLTASARPPFDYTVDDGFLQQLPSEYVRAQTFIREGRKGRKKQATAAFFEIPDSAIQSILA
jgi:hypothetical protein